MGILVRKKIQSERLKLLEVIFAVESFPEFINVIKAVRIDSDEEVNASRKLVGAVNISVKYFSGWVSFVAKSSPQGDGLDVELDKGPFNFARGKLRFQDDLGTDELVAVLEMDYLPLVPFYGSLIKRHKQTAFDQIINLFAVRSRTVG